MRKGLLILGVAGLIIVALAIALGLYFGMKTSKPKPEITSYVTRYVGGVVSNGYECAAIGSSILQKGGSAVDAAIATLFCEGIAMPHSLGVGGGFLMTIYIRKNRVVETLNARETAPIKATKDMFKGSASLASKGGLSVAVPGELRGYWDAHRKYGKLPWAELVHPTIELCRKGHLVTKYLARVFKEQEKQLFGSPTLSLSKSNWRSPGIRIKRGCLEVYINPKTNKSYEEGHYLKRAKLAKTLEIVAKDGANALYDGKLTKQFVEDIQNLGGIITIEDMKFYKTVWEPPIKASLPYEQTLYTTPLPGSGIILTFILNILKGHLDYSDITNITTWQRIVESFKFGYGKRTELGDPKFVDGIEKLIANLTSSSYAASIRRKITDHKTFNNASYYGANVTQGEDHGTAHISVLAANGDAVSVTSTINQHFGAGIRSVSTGIILNDEMDDFSSPDITNGFGVPPSPANYIAPHKRPLSSMCPSVVVDKHGDVVLVIGAAGGTKITTSVALVTMRNLWFKQSLATAVPASRLHHQLFPMQISFEHDFNRDIIKGLAEIGHNISVANKINIFVALTAIAKRNGIVEGSFDERRSGQVVLIT